ncbi:MAG: NAD-dependent epimerase/dehydratase family protein [Ruminococcaceae bacterium]|nr:NAD-dependent epimerase/dehydratase family protein [Oscillospiraceae bacterium]
MDLMENQRYIRSLAKLRLEELAGKTVVITGATGMIGSCLVDALSVWNRGQTAPCRVVATSRRAESAQKRFGYCRNEPWFTYIRQDVCDEAAGWPDRVDYVIHAASNADPVSFAKAPVDTLMANVLGTDRLLREGLKRGMKRFLYVSSGEMYGQPDSLQRDFTEDYCGPLDHGNPRACYPAGKRAAEVLCQCYGAQYGADCVIVRPCHTFGPTMTAGDSRAVSEFLRSAAAGRNIGMKSAGLVERSHCYVVDAADAIFRVLLQGRTGGAYNIADPACQMTIREFARKAAEAGGCRVVFENPSDLEVKGYSAVSRQVLSAEKLMALGWTGRENAMDAITETVQILKEMR